MHRRVNIIKSIFCGYIIKKILYLVVVFIYLCRVSCKESIGISFKIL